MSETENRRAGFNPEVIVRRTTPVPNPILLWLAERGEGTAHDMAADLKRDPDSIGAALRAFRAEGRVRSVREERSPVGGRPRTVYALVKQQNDEEVPKMDSSNGTATAQTTPEPVGPTAEQLREVNEVDNLRADDMEELLAAYCGSLSLAESASETLLFVLRMRRVQDLLRATEGQSF